MPYVPMRADDVDPVALPATIGVLLQLVHEMDDEIAWMTHTEDPSLHELAEAWTVASNAIRARIGHLEYRQRVLTRTVTAVSEE